MKIRSQFILVLLPTVALIPLSSEAASISPTTFDSIPSSSPNSVFDINTHPANVYGLGPGTTLNTGANFDLRRLFGGNYGTDSVEFTDETKGFVNSVLVNLESPARLNSLYLYLYDDGINGHRSACEFRLYGDNILLEDVNILDTTGNQTYTGIYGSRYI